MKNYSQKKLRFNPRKFKRNMTNLVIYVLTILTAFVVTKRSAELIAQGDEIYVLICGYFQSLLFFGFAFYKIFNLDNMSKERKVFNYDKM